MLPLLLVLLLRLSLFPSCFFNEIPSALRKKKFPLLADYFEFSPFFADKKHPFVDEEQLEVLF